MRYLPNIEKSGFRPGEYTGYANDGVWRIWRSSKRTWTAQKGGQSFTRRTLSEISDGLDWLSLHPGMDNV